MRWTDRLDVPAKWAGHTLEARTRRAPIRAETLEDPREVEEREQEQTRLSPIEQPALPAPLAFEPAIETVDPGVVLDPERPIEMVRVLP